MKWGLVPFMILFFPLAACNGTAGSPAGGAGGGGGTTSGSGGTTSGSGGTTSGSGGTTSGSGGTTSGSGGTTSGVGGVAIGVTSASNPLQIDNTVPSGGNAFEELDVTLQNKSSTTPVSADFALFTLATDQSLVLNASAVSGGITPECSPTTSVATGGSFSCKLVFELPTGQKATMLHYDDKQGHQASATVPAPTPPPGSAACQQDASYWQEAQQNPGGGCSTCLTDAIQSGGACASTNSAWNAACGSVTDTACEQGCVGDGGLGLPCSCYQTCSSPACWSAIVDELQCEVAHCGSTC